MGVGTHAHTDRDVAARHSPGLSAVPSGAQGSLSLEMGRATCRSRTALHSNAPEIFLDAHGSCERARPVDGANLLRSQRNSLSRPPGRRAARFTSPLWHVEGAEWPGRMFWSGRHASYLPWRSAGRDPWRHAWAGAPSPRHRNRGSSITRSIPSARDGGLQPRESGSWHCYRHNAS
jgi:hypothetical protein